MSLLKSAGTVGGYTLLSRLLGFFRDQLIAFTFGTGPIAEAFVVAQRLPNLFRALFAEAEREKNVKIIENKLTEQPK